MLNKLNGFPVRENDSLTFRNVGVYFTVFPNGRIMPQVHTNRSVFR
jgi:hypothetical protein